MQDHLTLTFLGVGNAQARELGCSAAVLEMNGEPSLLFDCGPDTLHYYLERYQQKLPKALFLTHTHLDHIGGLENLFYRNWCSSSDIEPIKLYLPVRLVELVQKRIADYPSLLAEGGVNFWEAFQLIPVSDGFWHEGLEFNVFPVRHHEYLSAYGLSLSGAFLYTGDTKPIPEVITRYGCHQETLFHDCATQRNPSHTCYQELADNYRPEQLARMVFYHYESEDAGRTIEAHGYTIARQGQTFALTRGQLSLVTTADERLLGS
jgi:ribonuclease BN (tRNA processing enzyme)